MSKLNKAMQAIASFVMENTTNDDVKVCLIPGHFNTDEILPLSGNAGYKLVHSNVNPISAAGYQCDTVADDYQPDVNYGQKMAVHILGNSNRCLYADFLNYIKLSGLRVVKIKLTNLRTGNTGLVQFDKELEISSSAIGQRMGSVFVQLSSYKNPKNYDQNMIEIDLSEQQLELDETTLAFLTVAGGAKFNIEFTMAE